ncbi:MAG: alpha-amylase family glycosyl hydrolase, partial [Oscillospiraceae bacterium]
MFKKIIALFTCLCLTLSVTACTGSNGNNKLSKTEAQASVLDNYRTFYEVFVYSFCDSNGDGIGDLNGVTSKLDYIQDMGFTGIWLMPIMPSTTYHKYDVIDYESIDSQYGTMADFDNLIAECEKRNINVIIDLVLNHTSTQHKWFLSAKADENSEYRDYYNFEKEKPAGGKYYKTDKGFYEAMFWEGMPDLNLANVNLRKELENIMSFWLNKGVSGFRLDAAKEFYSGLPEKNIEVLTWVNDYCKSVKKDCYIVGEVWEDLEICAPYYKSGIDSFFNFSQASASGKIAKTILLDGEENTAQSYA